MLIREEATSDFMEAAIKRVLSDVRQSDSLAAWAVLHRQQLFVAITFVGMFAGLIGSWIDAPESFVWGSYTMAYICGGWYGLKATIESLRVPEVEIDLLMIVAAVGALYVGAPFEGAMLLFLFSLSNVLEDYAIGRSRRTIRSLIDMRPEVAHVRQNGETRAVPVDDVTIGDVFVVKPGDRLPLDGVVVAGESTIDQSTLTGESVPVARAPGDEVFGGTINETGSLEVEVTRTSHESAIARLIHMVEDAQSRRAPTQQLIDRFQQPYVIAVFLGTILAITIPYMIFSHAFEPTFYRAITLMVAASPCAVIISTPAAVLSAIAAGGHNGVLFKGGEFIETAGTVEAIAFDKTGTLTEGNTQLTDIVPLDTIDEDEILAIAAAVQSRSEHHLATATTQAADERSLAVPPSNQFAAVIGKGVRASVEGATIHIGNDRYFEAIEADLKITGLSAGIERVKALESAGKTSVLVVRQNEDEATVIGCLAFTDTIRPDAKVMLTQLRERGVKRIVMLTGDNERVAQQIAQELDIDEVHAELLPEDKVEIIQQLQEEYRAVAMVGDGVNDAPALATADISIGMGGAGTDVALETANIVLMSDRLERLPFAFALSKKTRRTLFVNFAIAFGAIAIMVIAILTAGIPLPIAVIGHEGSTVLVSLIGLRLLRFSE